MPRRNRNAGREPVKLRDQTGRRPGSDEVGAGVSPGRAQWLYLVAVHEYLRWRALADRLTGAAGSSGSTSSPGGGPAAA